MKRLIFGTILFLAGCPAVFGQTAVNNCPVIAVTGPSGVTAAGDTMTFTASVNNHGGADEIKYEWTVSAGTIEKGQGTSRIEVRTTREMGNSNVTATLKMVGFSAGCNDSTSELGSVASQPLCECSLDEFGRLSRDDIKARIDSFYIRLLNDPDAEGLIFVRFDTGETRMSKMLYLNDLYRAIAFRKYDPARVTFIISEVSDDLETRTTIYMIPPGADFPVLGDNPILIKGEDFTKKINDLFNSNK